MSNDKRSTCKVHLQHIDTFYSWAVCGVHICPESCFLKYHTLKDYYFNDEDHEGPWCLKAGSGKPCTKGRGIVLQNWTCKDKCDGGSNIAVRQWTWLTLRLSQRQYWRLVCSCKFKILFLYLEICYLKGHDQLIFFKTFIVKINDSEIIPRVPQVF